MVSETDKIKKHKIRTFKRKYKSASKNALFRLFSDLNLKTDEIQYMEKLDEEELSKLVFQNIDLFLEKQKSSTTLNKPLKIQILESTMNGKMKCKILNRLANDCSAKFTVYVEKLVRIPFETYVQPPLSFSAQKKELNEFLIESKNVLDSVVYGQSLLKESILDYICRWVTKGSQKTTPMIIGLCGPPGVGKTTIAKDGLTKILKLPAHVVNMGGQTDSSYVVGHNYCYEGSQSGIIVDILCNSGIMNPIIFFDEIDKLSDTSKGKEISDVLLNVIDETQNGSFIDRYIGSEFKIDLSRITFVFAFNDKTKVDPILLDRMKLFYIEKYNKMDQKEICKKYILPGLMDTKSNFMIPDHILNYIISKMENGNDGGGVRVIKRTLKTIIDKIYARKKRGSFRQKLLTDISFYESCLSNGEDKQSNRNTFSMYT